MTKKELIDGGWIDKYVLGLTSEYESGEVERLASLYPEVQEQINGSRNRICGNFNRNLTQPALRHALLTKRKILYSSAFAVGILMLAFAYICTEHFSLKKDYHLQNQKLSIEEARLDQMTTHAMLASERAKFQNASTTERIKLKGCEDTPEAEVLIFQCLISGRMMLRVIELPELPNGSRYEVWAKRGQSPDQLIGQLNQPIKYDSLYALETVKDLSGLQLNAYDPVNDFSEPVCMATVKK